ncbi:MAG: alpha/beta fold hydrolase [Myxococcales bacterium]|nr:alpha/beta fold hydrolase [Myxococcales bacterium]
MSTPAERRTIPVAGGAIAVTVRGEGPLALLAPGCGRPATDLDPLADALVAAGYRTAAVDYRGAGESTGRYPRTDLHAIAADLAAVIDALDGAPAIAIGHAFGNRVVRCLAADHPERVSLLVLLAAGGKVEPAFDSRAVWRHVLLSPPDAPARRAAIAAAFFAPGHDPDRWRDWETASIGPLLEAAGLTPLEDWWTGGRAPMLVVQGTLDRMAPPANAAALQADAPGRVARVDIDGAGHALLPERPDAVAAAVLGWLADPRVALVPPRRRDGGLWPVDVFLAELLARTAADDADFLLPHLRPGDRLLDCGCGPGGITRGLAAAVAPGRVVGLDLDRALLQRARRDAPDHAITWTRASATALPFADARFDVVFAHTLLMHLDDPPAVLAEWRRVLRPGGRIALVDADWGTEVIHPALPLLDAVLAAGLPAARAVGMDPHFGRRHPGLLRAAGFVDIQTSQRAAIVQGEAQVTAHAAGRIALLDYALKQGQLDPMSHHLAATAWRRWAEHPAALQSRARFRTLARRPLA